MKKVESRRLWLAVLFCTAVTVCLGAVNAPRVTLLLKNGDRLTGEVISETSERIVLSTPWNIAIYIPASEVEDRVVFISEPALDDPGTQIPESVVTEVSESRSDTVLTGKPEKSDSGKVAVVKAQPIPAKKPRQWKWNLKLGTDLVNGAKDRTIYFGQTALTYTRNYERNPKEFLRNKIDYRVDYGETEGRVSANRMVGANKLDFDIGSGYYGYAALGAGYDKVRKIDYQYELGPGLGYHLIAQKSLVVDAELGFNYQYREGLNSAPNREVVQFRVGQELTWEVVPKITLSEQVAFLPFMDDVGEYQVRLQGNLGFGIVRHLSLNLTVLNLYDTLPAPGVPNNEFQFRSSLGVNF
jgi:hypothetical protein